MCPSPEYFYSPYPEPEYVGVPLEPPGPPLEYEDATQAGLSTAAIIASQSQDYVDEKLAEYQATIHQLQGRAQLSTSSNKLVRNHPFVPPYSSRLSV
jgi:nesprin-1